MNIYIKFFFLISLSFVFKLNPLLAQPKVDWDKTYGGNSFESLSAAIKTADEGFLLCGSTSSNRNNEVSQPSFGNSDYWIIKIDSNGVKQGDWRFGGSEKEICHKAIQNEDGYLLIGSSISGVSGNKTAKNKGYQNVWIVQISPSGNILWDKTYGGSESDEPYNAVRTIDGGYIISCDSYSNKSGDKSEDNFGDKDIWIFKIDGNGNKIWDKSFGGSGSDDAPTALTATLDENFVVACGSTSGVSGNKTTSQAGVKDFWLIKFAPNGTKIWEKSFGGDQEEVPYDIQELTDGNLIVGGYSSSGVTGNKTAPNFGGSDYWLVKTDANGNMIWDKSFGGSKNDRLTCIDQNKTGYFLIAGMSESDSSGNKVDTIKPALNRLLDAGQFNKYEPNDFWLLYLNDNGEKIWEKGIGGNGKDVPFEMVKFQSGSYLICGGSNSEKGFDKSENNRNDAAFNNQVADDIWAVKISCFFEVKINNDTVICKLAPLSFNASVQNCKNCLYEWSTGEATSSITVRPARTTNYYVTITDQGACETTTRVTATVIPAPEALALVVKPPRCADGSDGILAIDSFAGGTPPYKLAINKDTFLLRTFYEKYKSGNYTVSLIDNNNCKIDRKVFIPNPKPFEITLTPSQEITFGDSIRIFATANLPLDTFFWSDKSFRTLDTIVKPFDSQIYSFAAVDKFGCKKTGVTQILVRRENLYYQPTAFSPNSDDKNDLFKIYGGKSVVSISGFQIFDRWGSRVYAIDKIYPSTEDVGWDGRLNGVNMLPAVYVYYATVTYIDGRSELITGDVTLMR